MAKIERGILGGLSGKIGGVVGSSWKGIAVLKAKPLSVANPNTAAQQAQRGKFSMCVGWGKNILTGVIKPCWDRFAIKSSGWADWVKANIDNFATGVVSAPAAIAISLGTLTLDILGGSTSADASADVTLNYTSTAGVGSGVASDEVYAVCWNEDKNTFGVSNVDTRSVAGAQSVVVTMSEVNDAGNSIHCYIAFRRADGTLVSNTNYEAIATV